MANLKYNVDAHRLDCIFIGKLDTQTSQEIQPVVEFEIETCQAQKPKEELKICFDFGEVEFITSTFIRICVASAKTVGKENFCIKNTNPLIKKTLKIAGLDGELNVS